MDLMHHFELHPLIHLNFFGIDMSITKAVVMMWIVGALLLVSFIMAARSANLVPIGFQKIIEPILIFIRDEIVVGVMGKENIVWYPFITTIFFFVLLCNLIGLIPGSFTATSNICVTGALALIVFFCTHITGIYKHGLFKYVKGALVPGGVPPALLVVMVPIEIISHLLKPISLAVRLFANMVAGHSIILVFIFLIVFFKSFIVAPIPLSVAVVMSAFEIGVSFIQAYIFAILSAIYISDAIHVGH